MPGLSVTDLVVLLDGHGFWPHRTCPVRYSPRVESAVAAFQATALDAEGKTLEVTGQLDERTEWALRNYTGVDQRLDLPPGCCPAGLSPLRKAVLGEYLKLINKGVREQPNGSNRSPEIDKLFPVWLQRNLAGTKAKGPAWCCFCYTKCHYLATEDVEGTGRWLLKRQQGSCKKASEVAKGLGLWVPNTALPVPGDAGVILHNSGTGHVFAVYRVSEDGKQMNTLEGNVSNRVATRLRRTNEVAGFIRADEDLCSGFQRGLVRAQNAANEDTR